MPVGFPDYYGGLTLPVTVAEGGTGQTSFTANAMLYGAGTSKLIETNVGTSGQILQINSTSLVPTFQDVDISAGGITGILALANGGTGTSSPALTAGSNISITGTWPNNTLAVASSPSFTGNATFTPATIPLIIGNPGNAGVGITMENTNRADISWNDSALRLFVGSGTGTPAAGLSIDTSGVLTLSTPLAVTSGGTGTSTPALIAGSNIGITGSWPDQTIALDSAITLGTSGTSNPAAIQFGSTDASGYTRIGTAPTAAVSGIYAEQFFLAPASGSHLLALDFNGNLGIAGTLFQTPLAQADLTGQTGSIGTTSLYGVPSAGFYRASLETRIINSGVALTLTASMTFTQEGTSRSIDAITYSSSAAGDTSQSGTANMYVDASTTISYAVAETGFGGADQYDLHIRLEKL